MYAICCLFYIKIKTVISSNCFNFFQQLKIIFNLFTLIPRCSLFLSPGGDSKTLMIVQVAPVEKNVAETVASLVFAQRVRAVELGQATRRVDSVDNSPSEVCNKRYVIEIIP